MLVSIAVITGPLFLAPDHRIFSPEDAALWRILRGRVIWPLEVIFAVSMETPNGRNSFLPIRVRKSSTIVNRFLWVNPVMREEDRLVPQEIISVPVIALS
jgi:hypothetical protein